MKKIFGLLLVLTLALSCMLVSCNSEDINAKSEGVMTYAEYAAAEMDSQVVIEAYVQAKQIYNATYGNTTLYLQDGEGAYFVYRLPCTQSEYDAIKVGNKVKVTGYKSAWSGEVEIVDPTISVIGGNYIAKAFDATSIAGDEEALLARQNQLVAFKNAEIVSIEFKSGEPGDDIYVTAKVGTATISFCLEVDLITADTDVYNTVKALNAGDKVDIECFLYWYNAPNPHIIGVTVK